MFCGRQLNLILWLSQRNCTWFRSTVTTSSMAIALLSKFDFIPFPEHRTNTKSLSNNTKPCIPLPQLAPYSLVLLHLTLERSLCASRRSPLFTATNRSCSFPMITDLTTDTQTARSRQPRSLFFVCSMRLQADSFSKHLSES